MAGLRWLFGTSFAGIFASGVIWLLFHSAYQFSRILFVRPVR
jgi:hypothetical protein